MKFRILILAVVLALILLPSIYAFEFDNQLKYENNDLRIRIDNWFGLGKNYGIAELKSHSSINQIKKVGVGWQVVMYYDFNFNERYINGLGNVEFFNLKNGKQIDKDYNFVYWGETTRPKYETTCVESKELNLNGSTIVDCTTTQTGTETYNTWLPYNSKDIPEGNIRIGLRTYVEDNDYIDGVWTIAGKRVDKHAAWEGSYGVDLLYYYAFNENGGNISVELNNSINNITLSNSDMWVAGKNLSAIYSGTEPNLRQANSIFGLNSSSDEFTINFWIKRENITQEGYYNILSNADVTDANLMELGAFQIQNTPFSNGTIEMRMKGTANSFSQGGVLNESGWQMISYTGKNGEPIQLFVNGVNRKNSSNIEFPSGFNQTKNLTIFGATSGTSALRNHSIDELVFWSRKLTQIEIESLYNNGDGLFFDEEGPIFIDVALINPEDELETTSSNIKFSANIRTINGNSTNATLYIWNESSGIFYNETLTNNTNQEWIVNYSVSDISFGNYEWNILACGTDEITDVCSWGINNRSFSVQEFETTNLTFSSNVYETQEAYFAIDINTTSDAELFSASLNYSGRLYPATTQDLGDGLFRVFRIIDIPTITTDTTTTFNFILSIDIGGGFSTRITDFNTITINDTDIVETSGENRINFTIRDEDTLTLIEPDFEGVFEWWLGSGTETENKSFDISSSSEFLFQTDPYNETFNLNSEIVLSLEATNISYNQRSFDFIDEIDNNNLTRTLYLLNDTRGTDVTIELRDAGIAALSDYLVKLYRFYPEKNERILVESKKTDIFGQAPVRVIQRDVRYRIEIFDTNNNLVKVENTVFFICRQQEAIPCVAQFIVRDDEDILERFNELSDYDYTLRYLNNTQTFEFVWNDNRDESSIHRMEIIKRNFNGNEIVSNQNSSDNPGIMTYTITSTDRATYTAQVFRISGGNERRVDILDAKIGDVSSTFGDEGLIWAFFLLLTMITAGMFHPPTGIILYLGGILFLGVMNIVFINPVIIVSSLVIGILFIWAFRG